MPRTPKNEPVPVAPAVTLVDPSAALPGGEVDLVGTHLGPVLGRVPVVMVGEMASHVTLSRSERITLRLGEEAVSGSLRVLQNGARSNPVAFEVARPLASGIHAVTSPAVDRSGSIYTTLSGPRGQATPVSVYKIGSDQELRPLLSGLMNATGIAAGPDGYLYVSSRNDGTVHRVSPAGAASQYAEGMGVATGLAFDAAQNLYVGDRSGTIFKIAPDRQIFVFATLEPSVSAYHLAFGPAGVLYVTGPTTSSYDCVYAIDRDGNQRIFYKGLGRPQGLAIDAAGNVYVAASLNGRRGIVRVTANGEANLVVAGTGIAGLAFGRDGNAVVATAHAIYDLALGVEGLQLF